MSEMPQDGPRHELEQAPGGGAEQTQTPPLAVLEELRERILLAVGEIEHLRRKNRELARRVEELAARQPDTAEDGGAHMVIPSGADPAELKTRVEAFIGALDRALEVYDHHEPNSATESA